MTPPPANARPFTRAFVLAAGIPLLALAAFLMLVDPYGIWRHRGMPTAGYEPMTWSRIASAERLNGRCDVAFIGSSRVVYGLGTKVGRIGGAKVCNAGLGGTSMVEIEQVLRFVADETRIKRVVLFLDLHMFHDGLTTNHDFAQSRFSPDRDPVTYHAWSLASWSALGWAMESVGLRLPGFDGLKPALAPSHKNRGLIKASLMQERMYRQLQGPDVQLDAFARALDHLEERNVQVTAVIPAVHAMQLEVIHEAGLWELNKDWRRWLTEVLWDRDIVLWDFATYHSPATADLPRTVVEDPSPWWADISHQSEMLGRLSLERLMDAAAGSDDAWEERFGVRLTPANIEDHLDDLDAGRADWIKGSPEQAAWFQMVAEHAIEEDPTIPDARKDQATRVLDSRLRREVAALRDAD